MNKEDILTGPNDSLVSSLKYMDKSRAKLQGKEEMNLVFSFSYSVEYLN